MFPVNQRCGKAEGHGGGHIQHDGQQDAQAQARFGDGGARRFFRQLPRDQLPQQAVVHQARGADGNDGHQDVQHAQAQQGSKRGLAEARDQQAGQDALALVDIQAALHEGDGKHGDQDDGQHLAEQGHDADGQHAEHIAEKQHRHAARLLAKQGESLFHPLPTCTCR